MIVLIQVKVSSVKCYRAMMIVTMKHHDHHRHKTFFDCDNRNASTNNDNELCNDWMFDLVLFFFLFFSVSCKQITFDIEIKLIFPWSMNRCFCCFIVEMRISRWFSVRATFLGMSDVRSNFFMGLLVRKERNSWWSVVESESVVEDLTVLWDFCRDFMSKNRLPQRF